ncbi:diguanylate cyclase [Frankia sp. Cpl3]|nr:diguanylate cyclase [Frankia sp. Cpl3]
MAESRDESGVRARRPGPALIAGGVCGAFALLTMICVVVLPEPHDLQSVDMACTGATLALTVVLLVTARRAPEGDRPWRLLVGITAFGGFLISILNAWHGLVHGVDVYNEIKISHATFLLAYLPALAGLLLLPSDLVLARAGPRSLPRRHSRHWYTITVLDSTLIVGSAALAAWATLLAPVIHRTSLSRPALTITFSATAVGLILVVAAALLGTVRRPRSVRVLALLGAGIAVLSLTMGAYLYFAAATNGKVPAAVHLGYLVSWLLLLLGALVRQPDRPPASDARPRIRSWVFGLRAALPYLAFAAVGVLTLIRLAVGARLDDLDLYGLIGLLMLLVSRQLATIGENTQLLSLVDASRRELHHQAFHDPLTGVANRALFAERLERAVTSHARRHRPLAVLYCDVDDFKRINDNLGHSAGDVLLRAVASRLRNGTRDTDTVARLGGDEFAVVLDNASGDPEAVARRLACTLRAPFRLAGRGYPVGISLGLVVADPSSIGADAGTAAGVDGGAALEPARSARSVPATPVTADSLLRDADIAMYEAKSSRQGGLVVRRAGTPAASSPVQLGGQLAAALRGEPGTGTLDVAYRPVVDLVDGRTVASHARARWTHPDLGRIEGGRLGQLADRAGFARAVDMFLLQRCCRDLAGAAADAGRPDGLGGAPHVADDVRPEDRAVRPAVLVPFSASRAVDGPLVTDILEVLAEYGLPAHLVIPGFSVAAAGAGQLATARTMLGRLRRHGVRCALTDVAGDPATLSMLGLLPVDIIRLDETLSGTDETLSGTDRDAQASFHTGGESDVALVDAIRRALVAEAARRGRTVIAPAIRGEGQERRLAADGCHLGEGPLYDRPHQKLMAELSS